ncbi:unnamed protein product, partial [Phaeothamnion confervicola]
GGNNSGGSRGDGSGSVETRETKARLLLEECHLGKWVGACWLLSAAASGRNSMPLGVGALTTKRTPFFSRPVNAKGGTAHYQQKCSETQREYHDSLNLEHSFSRLKDKMKIINGLLG